MGFLKSVAKAAAGFATGGVGGALISGGLSFLGSERQNAASTANSAQQMAFQERMSSTAHQREVADLRKAGLNPILSAKLGGASSPGGSMPNIQNSLGVAVDSARSTYAASSQAALQKSQLGLAHAQEGLIAAQTASAQAAAEGVRLDNVTKAVDAQIASSAVGEILRTKKNYGTGATLLKGISDAWNHFTNNSARDAESRDEAGRSVESRDEAGKISDVMNSNAREDLVIEIGRPAHWGPREKKK